MWGDPGKRQQGKDPGGYQGPAREGRTLAHSSLVPIWSENINPGRTGLAGRSAGRETEHAGGGGRAGAGALSPRVDPGAAAGLRAFSRWHLSGAWKLATKTPCSLHCHCSLVPSPVQFQACVPYPNNQAPSMRPTNICPASGGFGARFLTVPRAASAQSAGGGAEVRA